MLFYFNTLSPIGRELRTRPSIRPQKFAFLNGVYGRSRKIQILKVNELPQASMSVINLISINLKVYFILLQKGRKTACLVKSFVYGYILVVLRIIKIK